MNTATVFEMNEFLDMHGMKKKLPVCMRKQNNIYLRTFCYGRKEIRDIQFHLYLEE